MKTKTAVWLAFSISLVAAASGLTRAANFQSGTELFSNAAPVAAALAARAKASFTQSQNEAAATLDPKTMSELTSVAKKIYRKNGERWKRGGMRHAHFDIQVNAASVSGKSMLQSIVISVNPWKIETKCTTRFLSARKCLFDKFSPLLMTVVIHPDGNMLVISDPGYGKHTKEEMIDYAKKYAVGFWLGRFSKPVFFPLF
ncbi:MAG TPA: hypothetical protein VNH15_05270 [Elusimicrobiota bacterium]|nr:hypothetical protein [Elusimicrobiota bacterium]